jgi:phage-related protein
MIPCLANETHVPPCPGVYDPWYCGMIACVEENRHVSPCDGVIIKKIIETQKIVHPYCEGEYCCNCCTCKHGDDNGFLSDLWDELFKYLREIIRLLGSIDQWISLIETLIELGFSQLYTTQQSNDLLHDILIQLRNMSFESGDSEGGRTFWDWLAEFLTEWIFDRIGNLFDTIVELLADLVRMIAEWLLSLMTVLFAEVLKRIFDVIVGIINGFMSILTGAIELLTSLMSDFFALLSEDSPLNDWNRYGEELWDME